MGLKNVKLAIVCDWLTNMGGAEKVILALHQIFPSAPIYTSLYNAKAVQGFENAKIITSNLQKIPLAKNHHQLLLPFMPGVFERFDFSDYDIVISSSHSCAKGIITNPDTMHVSYCHTPMRYAWEGSNGYINEYQINSFIKSLAKFYIHKIRIWDRLSAERVDHFLANSHYVQQRISKYYKKPSTVITPFIDLDSFKENSKRDKYFLAVGRLTPYKRFDLLVETFNDLGLPLKIVGSGVQMNHLKKIAKPNIEFLGRISDSKLHELYSNAKAFLFPQLEDFGITPLEAMSTGCPVIAYAKGGALETVVDGKTGIFFHQQTVDSLRHAIFKFHKTCFKAAEIRKHAENFDRRIFNQKLLDFLEAKWKHHLNSVS